jgi:hypothetical protein
MLVINILCFSTAYCVVAVESVGRQVPIAFLDRVKEDFTKRYGGGKATTAAVNSLNREFGYVLFVSYVMLNQFYIHPLTLLTSIYFPLHCLQIKT